MHGMREIYGKLEFDGVKRMVNSMMEAVECFGGNQKLGERMVSWNM